MTSLFIPFAYGDLPRNTWIKLLAGVHGVLVVAGGVSTLFAYMQKRLNNLYAAIDSVNTRLKDQELSTKLSIFEAKLKAQTAAATEAKPKV